MQKVLITISPSKSSIKTNADHLLRYVQVLIEDENNDKQKSFLLFKTISPPLPFYPGLGGDFDILETKKLDKSLAVSFNNITFAPDY